MPRRRQKQDPKLLLGTIVAIGAIWFVVQLLQSGSGQFFIASLVILVAAYFFIRHRQQADTRRALFFNVENKIRQQIRPLVRRRAQLVQADPYGRPRMESWDAEIGYFITAHIEPFLAPKERVMLQRERTVIVKLIEMRVTSAMLGGVVTR